MALDPTRAAQVIFDSLEAAVLAAKPNLPTFEWGLIPASDLRVDVVRWNAIVEECQSLMRGEKVVWKATVTFAAATFAMTLGKTASEILWEVMNAGSAKFHLAAMNKRKKTKR